MGDLNELRGRIRAAILADEAQTIARLKADAELSEADRAAIGQRALKLVEKVRAAQSSGMLESFLAEYSLSTDEGIALMCLAEALLRVPDNRTIDDLIEDKIAPSRWAEHLDRANSALVNVSTLALTLTGSVLREGGAGIAGTIKNFVQRIGEPVIALKRLRLLDGQPVAIAEDWIEARKTPGLLALDWAGGNRSLYDELRHRYGLAPEVGETVLSSRLATAEEARLLDLRRPAAILTVEQIAHARDGSPINATRSLHHPARYPLRLAQGRRASP